MKKRYLTVLTITVVCVASILTLHSLGYRIYGHPYMYRSAPPDDEGWIKVVSLDRDSIRLSDESIIQLKPFYLTEKALSSKDPAESMFGVEYDDLYVRRENDSWIVRVGDRFLCSHSSFFPERHYGYYESEIIQKISLVDFGYNIPGDQMMVGVVGEEALRQYYFGDQNKTVDSMSASSPIESL